MTAHEPLLTPEQVAEYLNITPRALAEWRQDIDHPLVWYKVGRYPRYRQEDLLAFLEQVAMRPGR